jgi:hypothetical protein
MSLTLDLPPQLAAELASEAARRKMPLQEYALHLLSSRPPAQHPQLKSGAELVQYWQEAGLVGTCPEIMDPSQHARDLRAQAQRRDRS